MKYLNHRSLFGGVKGKVIIAFLLACLALTLAWAVSRVVFKKMLQTVENIATPNDRLLLVNNLSRSMIHLDQLQRTQGVKIQGKSNRAFLKESKQIRLIMDTLSHLYSGNPEVSKRLDSMKGLLQQRDKLFMNYLQVRKGLINNKNFSDQVQALSGIINHSSNQKDSTLVTTKKTVSTTTFYPPEQIIEKKTPKGLFNRLFGKPEEKKETPLSNRVVDEELKVEVDTVALAKKDSIMQKVGKTMRNMEINRRQQSKKFINQEAQLTEAGNVLVTQMSTILEQVEKEVVKLVEQNNIAAKTAINSGIKRIGLIIIAFFLLIIVLLYLILTDIARSVKYRRELEQAKDEAEYHSMAKQRFLSNMSHEIRTPLQSIIGYAELVKQQPNPREKELDAIYQSSIHLLQIVNEVLDYSRIISGKFTFETKDFNIREVLEEVVLVMRPQALQKSLELVSDFTIDGCEWIKGDPFRLKQILFNLLSNAIKFTETGKITLSTNCKHHLGKNHFKFTVTDTGRGIAEQEIQQIFEAFEHNNPLPQNNQDSTGLGLSIVKALTETQGGRIYVNSKPGEGSCFTLYISYPQAEPTSKILPISNPLKRMHYSGKVWIVDDDRFILDLCDVILQENGIDHRCFASPDEILNTPWDKEVTCILLDIRMPGKTGNELLSILRKRTPIGLKIFALTAQALPGEQEAILQYGFDGLLMKPFRQQELLHLIFKSNALIVDEEYPKIQLDLRALEQMTYGDATQLKKILTRFIIDSTEDIQQLQLAQKETENEQSLLLIHRIAGRTAQLGSKELASRFRALEITLQQNGKLNEYQWAEVNICLQLLKDLIETVRLILITQSDTFPSYYTASSDQY